MKLSLSTRLLPAATLVAFLAFASAVQAATIPFTNDFGSSGFSNQTAGFSATGGQLVNAVSGTTAIVSTASEQFSGLMNESFSVSSQFTYTSAGTLPSAVSSTAAFAIFGQNATFSGGANPYVLAGVNVFGAGTGSATPGNVFLQAVGTGYTMTTTSAQAISGALALNTTYTLKLDVTNTAANTYGLSLGLYDSTGATLLGSLVTASLNVTGEPVGGYHLGLRTRNPYNGSSTGTTTMVFDNYSVTSAIPEPSAYAMFAGVAMLGFAGWRRRRG